MPNDNLEQELWDDAGKETPPIFHEGCGGRVYWIWDQEFRCLKCCAQVEPHGMLMAAEEPNGPTTDAI